MEDDFVSTYKTTKFLNTSHFARVQSQVHTRTTVEDASL